MTVFWEYPHQPMITHTIDRFILDQKPILLTSSYWIPSQNKTKSNLQILRIFQTFKFWKKKDFTCATPSKVAW